MDPAAAGLPPMPLSPLLEDSAGAGADIRRDIRQPTPMAETSSKTAKGCSGSGQARPQSGSGRRMRGLAWDCWETHEPHWTSSANKDRGSLSRTACRSPIAERLQQPRPGAAERYTPDATTSRAQTPIARAAHRRAEDQRRTYASPHPFSAPSSPKSSESASIGKQLQSIQREANMSKAFSELSLGHKWLRIIMDGIEAVLELLRPRMKNLEHLEQSPTILDVHRMTMKMHADLLGGFQDLQEDCAKDELLSQVSTDGLAKSFDKSWASTLLPFASYSDSTDRNMVKPIIPEEASAIEVLLRFVTGLDKMPIWPRALEAAIDVMQVGVSSVRHGRELNSFASCTQQLMHELQGVHRDVREGLDRTREAISQRDVKALRPTSSRPTSAKKLMMEMPEVLEADSAETMPCALQELGKVFDQATMIKRMTTRASKAGSLWTRGSMLTRGSMKARKSLTKDLIHMEGRRPSLAITDPQSAALWGVTLEQLCDFYDEIGDDLCGYCESHRKMVSCAECMHVCLENENCEWDHNGILYVKQSDVLDTEVTVDLLPNTYAFVDREVKPRTKDVGCSYALMLNPEGIKSNIFVTHAWSEPLKELVGTLKMAVALHDVLWICSLAINQNDPSQAALNASDMANCPFLSALKQVKKQVVALDEHLHVPDRAWCTLEIMTASLYGINVSLWFYRIGCLDALLDKVENLDMTKAVASSPDDVMRIQEVIKSQGDIKQMSEHVRDVLYDRLSFHKQMLMNGNYVPSAVHHVQKDSPEKDNKDNKDKVELEVCRQRLHDLERELQAQKRRQAEVSQKIHQKQKDQAEKRERVRRKRPHASKEEIEAFVAAENSPEQRALDEKAIQKLKREEAQAQVRLEMLEEVRQSVERELRDALEEEMEKKEEEFEKREREIKAEKRKYLLLAEEMERSEQRQKELVSKARELDVVKTKLAEVEEELSWLRGEHAVAQYTLKRQETKPIRSSVRSSADYSRASFIR